MGLLDGVERLHAALDYHLARHNVLTANLSHIDTPGYRPLDLARGTSNFASVFGVEIARTDPRHMSVNSPAGVNSDFHVIPDPNTTPGYDGNEVSLDRESVKIATNQLRYDTIATLTTSELTGLVWAANDGRRP